MQAKNQIPEENQALIREHMPFAIGIARRFKRERPNIEIEIEDYIAAAYLGLCDAASRFDPSQGHSFRSYSFLRIRGSLYDLLRKTFGIARSCFEEVTETTEVAEEEEEEEGSGEGASRSSFVVCNDLRGLSSLAVVIEEYGLRIHRRGEDGPALSYANGFDPEEAAENTSLARSLERSMRRLPEKQRHLLYRRYYHSETFDEIGSNLEGASRSWLSRVHGKALKNMREQLRSEELQCNERVRSYG